VTFGDHSFKDRVELRPDDFYTRLSDSKQLPTTSQPTPADFVKTFRSALEEADDVVAVLVSGTLSGTFNSAQTAARVAGLERVSFVDSRSASLGEGMLALRAAELAESGWPASRLSRSWSGSGVSREYS
jgi:DegV family protein with EDD domain